MKKRLKKLLKVVLPLAFGIFFVAYAFYRATPEQLHEIWANIKDAKLKWIGLSLLFGALSHLSRAYRWYYLLEPLGYRPKYINNVLTVLIAYLANLGIPRSGEVFRATAMTAYEDIPFEKAFGTIVTERVIDLIMLIATVLSAFILQYDIIVTYFQNKHIGWKQPLVILLIVIAIIWLFLKAIKKSNHPLIIKLKSFLSGLLEGISSIWKMRNKMAFIGHTLFIWAMYVLMFYVMKYSISGVENVPFSIALTAFVAGAFAMAGTNGGIGLYPVAVAVVLTSFGVKDTTAQSFGWVMWIAQTGMVVVFGALAFISLPLVNHSAGSTQFRSR